MNKSNEQLANEQEGRCRCPDDSGSCAWCDIYYGRIDLSEETRSDHLETNS